ncbi:cytochrome P450 monooxygenase [Penicillium viridicatum]|nr:cytochrome P450 monooxygenase [Penicillium viridicatum]
MLNDTPEVPVGFLGGLTREFIAPIGDASKSYPQFWLTLTSPVFLDNLKSYFGASAGILLTLVLVYTIARSVYLVTWHPYAKYPGPFLAKFTILYSAYHALKGDLHLDMWKCHQKYGDYVRYTPNRLLVNTTEGLKEIYQSAKQIQKSPDYQVMNLKVASTFTEVDKKIHERKRRLVSHGFSDASLRLYEPRILTNVTKLVNRILSSKKAEDGWTESLNIGDFAGDFAFDVMTSVIYGLCYNLQEDPKYRFIIPVISGVNFRIGILSQAPMLAWRKMDRYIFRRAIKARNVFLGFVGKIIKDRMKATDITGDAFSILFAAKDDELKEGLSRDQLNAESLNFVVAGSDTTATSMSATIFYLTRYPDAYAKAVAEVRSAFHDINDVRLGPALNSCEYLRACINEAMRMSPPVGSALWRKVLPGGLSFGGEYVPEGCELGTGIYSIHHNSKYYRDPFVYRPERWFSHPDVNGQYSEEAALELEEAKAAFNPFSLGMRGCVGKALAMNEIMLAFAALLVSCDIQLTHCEESRLGEGSKNAEYGRHRVFEYQVKDWLIACRNGPMVKAKAWSRDE